MSRSWIVFAAISVAAVGMFSDCKNNPTGSTVQPRNVILSDGFEYGGDSLVKSYSQMIYLAGRGMMSTTTAAAHSGRYSLTTDSSKTGIKKQGVFSIEDSIGGLEFYLKAKRLGQCSFYSAIGRGGSSWNGLYVILGMGIGPTDSLQYIYQYDPTKPNNEIKNIDAVQPDKWYKCTIECNFKDTTVTYFLDDRIVGSKKTSDMISLNVFLVGRDSVMSQGAGSEGPKEYYFDDFTIYKR